MRPEKSSIRASLGIYLERDSVHVCTQLCTRGYTIVYTRVYTSPLSSRYTLGLSTPRTQMFLPSGYAP